MSTPMDAPLPLVVSIHDVRPGLFDKVVRMLETLQREGVKTTTLLVIPNFHREEPLEHYPHMVEQIRQWGQQGHELQLHALYHREDPPPTQGPLAYMVSRHYTNGEGEFYRLSQEEATQRLQHGLALFKQLRFETSGFTAPAWLYSTEATHAIAALGFNYYTTLWGVQATRHPEDFIDARAVVWSHRAAWRRATSNLVLPWIAQRLLQRQQPLRIALHPPDFQYDSIRSCVLRILARALRSGYQPMTYLDLVNQRLAGSAFATTTGATIAPRNYPAPLD